MKRISLLLIYFLSFNLLGQDITKIIGPDSQVFISQSNALAVHYPDFGVIIKDTSGILSSSETGDLLANSMVGPGDFYIQAKLLLPEIGGTAASFMLGNNFFGFDGLQTDIYLNGPIFGQEVISLKSNKNLISPAQYFDFEIIRVGDEIRFLIDKKEIHKVQSEDRFSGNMGFRPVRASMEIAEFSAKGNLIPVSLSPRGFTIPIIDISHETRRQVTIDKEKNKYLGHPTTILLEDGKSMLIVYPQGHGDGPILMKKSLDRGLTWSERLPVPASWASSKEVPTLYPTIDPSGKKRIIMFSGLNPIRMAYSENSGQTWSELEPIFNFGGIVAMGDMIRLKNGGYMAFFHDDGRFITDDKKSGRLTVYGTSSSDGGLTWSFPQIVATDKHMQLCEPGLIRSPDGHQLAMLLRENGRKYNSAIVFSDDEGKTWSTPKEMPASLTGDRHQCLYAPDGRLVITFRDHTYQSPMSGDFVAWVGQYSDLVEGTEGQYRIRLLDNKSQWDCGYPAFEVFEDGTFFAATYGKWDHNESNYVMGTRFHLDEIDQKAGEIPEVTDIFIAGKEGYHTYRIPALWQTQGGVLLAFAEGRNTQSDHAANDIVLKRSFDGGITWKALQIVAEEGDDCLNNPMIVEDRNTGKLILMYQLYPEGYHERQVGAGYDSDTICRSYVRYSSDQGASWSAARDITRSVKRPTWVTSIAGGPGNGIQLHRGPYKDRIIMPFNQGPAGKWKVYAVYSDDGGNNWTYGEIAFEDDPGQGNEVQMVELSDGSIRINSRSASGKKVRKTAISTDGGENWTGLKDVPALIESECMGSIIRHESDQYETPLLLFSNPFSQVGREFGFIQVSSDDGESWFAGKCVYNGSFAYSSLASMSGDHIGLLFERDNYTRITFLKTSLSWLTRKE